MKSILAAFSAALAGVGLATDVAPAAEFAPPTDYGARSKSWRLDASAERLLAEWGKVPYRRKADRTDFFVRAQLKYGLNRKDFLHHWYDRPLLQDSSLSSAEGSDSDVFWLNTKGWEKTVAMGRMGKQTGFAVFTCTKGREDVIPLSIRPGSETTILVELTRGLSVEECVFRAKQALDIEFLFPFGWGEIQGVHHRGQWDMSRHCEFSKQEQDCKYFDQDRKESYFPTVVESSSGLDRICLMLLCNAYDEDTAATQKEGKDEDVRIVMHLPARVAPVQVAILPLSKKLEEPAEKLYHSILKKFRAEYDDTGSIGKRYRRQDEIGTPFCVTFDFDTLNDNAVTVRDRDSMTQERIAIDQLAKFLDDKINPEI